MPLGRGWVARPPSDGVSTRGRAHKSIDPPGPARSQSHLEFPSRPPAPPMAAGDGRSRVDIGQCEAQGGGAPGGPRRSPPALGVAGPLGPCPTHLAPWTAVQAPYLRAPTHVTRVFGCPPTLRPIAPLWRRLAYKRVAWAPSTRTFWLWECSCSRSGHTGADAQLQLRTTTTRRHGSRPAWRRVLL